MGMPNPDPADIAQRVADGLIEKIVTSAGFKPLLDGIAESVADEVAEKLVDSFYYSDFVGDVATRVSKAVIESQLAVHRHNLETATTNAIFDYLDDHSGRGSIAQLVRSVPLELKDTALRLLDQSDDYSRAFCSSLLQFDGKLVSRK